MYPATVPDLASDDDAAGVPAEGSRSLWVNLPASIHADSPRSMEEVDQAYGYILYRTKIEAADEKSVPGNAALLKIDALHSYARVYVDGNCKE